MNAYKGIVQKGLQRGTELGFPTINIPLENTGESGIYAARVRIGDEALYIAAAFADSEKKILEAHILDFSDELYGSEVTIELHKKLRDTEQFADDDALRAAIAADVAKVREYFILRV